MAIPKGRDKGTGELGCVLRILFQWLVPIGSCLFGASPGFFHLFLSLLGSAAEVALFIVRHQNVPGKKRHSIRPAGFFPLQLIGLYIIQFWLIMFFDSGAEANEPLLPVTDGLPGLDLGLEERNGIIRPSKPKPADSMRNRAASSARGEPVIEFELDAPIESLRWEPRTISVVLPCAEEREYALKTVESVYSSTSSDVLEEIIVVDDGSDPPLASTYLPPDVQEKYRTRVLRHERTTGLIGAKKTGGDAAIGDIIVFFDCHVAPQGQWYVDFLRLSSANYRRMVVPQITALDINTWQQVGQGGGMAKCYLTWDGDFKWVQSDDDYIPAISGGLLGMSNRWWKETGGYDSEMLGWGGENLDQSLRVWLCGGEIIMAKNAYVAHMWRSGSAKTRKNYKVVGDSSRNRARAVYGWYGEFSQKLQDYPAFSQRYKRNPNWFGDLGNFDKVRKNLAGCRPFAWFLRRFQNIYVAGGLLPQEIFMLREDKSGLCLRFTGAAGTSGHGRESAVLKQCDPGDDRFYWHFGNTIAHTRTCCSGIRAWNTDQCLANAAHGKVDTFVCAMAGNSYNQVWEITRTGQLKQGNSCLGLGDGAGMLEASSCLLRSGATWTKLSVKKPLETHIYERAMEEKADLFRGFNS